MSLPFVVLCLLTLSSMCGSHHRTNYSRAGLSEAVTTCWGTCISVCAPVVRSLPLPLFVSSDALDLAHLISVMALPDKFTISESCLCSVVLERRMNPPTNNKTILRCLIVLLQLISRNVQPNPGPDTLFKLNPCQFSI